MNSYEMMIDPTTFGTVANYLRNPRTPIEFVLHVRDRSLLAGLAQHLEPLLARGGITPANLPALLAEPLQAGTVRISSRQPMNLPDSRQCIAADSIPRRAQCEVLYLPPFYLVHTPGLFAGTLAKPNVAAEHTEHEHNLRPHRFKL